MLTTLHGAKGLEWPVVFLVGMEEELLPHARTLYPQGPTWRARSTSRRRRRLAYVGITRARERLYLSRALERRKHGKERLTHAVAVPRRDPRDLVEKRDLAAEAQKPRLQGGARRLLGVADRRISGRHQGSIPIAGDRGGRIATPSGRSSVSARRRSARRTVKSVSLLVAGRRVAQAARGQRHAGVVRSTG
jgi:DNA helicase-2/ATP-dependent DNA helicase PcrA